MVWYLGWVWGVPAIPKGWSIKTKMFVVEGEEFMVWYFVFRVYGVRCTSDPIDRDKDVGGPGLQHRRLVVRNRERKHHQLS